MTATRSFRRWSSRDVAAPPMTGRVRVGSSLHLEEARAAMPLGAIRPARTRVALLAAVASFLVLSLAQALQPADAGAATIQQRIARAVSASGVAGSTSVVVYDVAGQAVEYVHQPTRNVAPASNQKLYTAAALLQGLGPQHRFTTRVALRGTQHGTTFRGNVYLVGGGDPSLSTREFARRNFAGRGGSIELLVTPLQLRGIRRVEGALIADDDYLDERRFVPAWPARFRYDQSAPLGALTVNHNQAGAGVRASATRSPDAHAAAIYRNLLRERGIRIAGPNRSGSTPVDAQVVGTVESPPVGMLLRYMNKHSDNFTAEILLKDLGRERRGTGTTAAGARAAKEQLTALGVDTSPLRIVDGSGLSVANRATARNLADLLNIVDRHPQLGPYWLESMAITGRRGTLERRLARRPYKLNVRGKTGTLRQVSALSGYATRADGTRKGFSVVTYDRRGIAWSRSRQLQDDIASILVR